MKITAIETVWPGPDSDIPFIIFVRVHTDEGLIGTGETCYIPDAIAGVVHQFAGPLLLGQDPLAIEHHWNRIYELAAKFGARGAEMRALAALDVALWDILGQAAGMPIYRLLGGAPRPIETYNTCGGPRYGSGKGPKGDGRAAGPGWGDPTPGGELDDFHGFLNRPGELAQELVEEGFRGMKIWPYDQVAQASGGMHITPEGLEQGARPFAEIRRAVGDQIEIMAEGHGFWSLPMAIRIARRLEEYRPAWLEDFILADDPGALRELRAATTIPLSVSEYLMNRQEYLPILERRAADVLMVDPTWAGGITETKKIVSLADTYSLPVTMHDCTGPFTMLAGMHVALSSPNVLFQEVVRAFVRIVYPQWVDESVQLVKGKLLPPERPGIGAALAPQVLQADGVVIQTSR